MTFIEEVYQKPQALKLLIDKYFDKHEGEAGRLKSTVQERKFSQVIFTGMGSSLFASYIPCLYLKSRGIRAVAVESGELVRYCKPIIDGSTLLVAVSQSGESEEVIELCSQLKDFENLVIVTNYTGSSLYKYGKVKFEIYAGPEYTTASKTYTNTIAALIFIAYIIAGADDEEIDRLRISLADCAELMEKILGGWRAWINDVCRIMEGSTYIPVVGSGASYSTASHGELVLEEAARIFSSRYTTGQFIHGPIELINEDFRAIILDFDRGASQKVDRILNSVVKYGGKALLLTNRDINAADDSVYTLKINHENPLTSPIVEILPIELLVNEIGLRKNFRPGILTKVIK